jgi:hypothetical protein
MLTILSALEQPIQPGRNRAQGEPTTHSMAAELCTELWNLGHSESSTLSDGSEESATG